MGSKSICSRQSTFSERAILQKVHEFGQRSILLWTLETRALISLYNDNIILRVSSRYFVLSVELSITSQNLIGSRGSPAENIFILEVWSTMDFSKTDILLVCFLLFYVCLKYNWSSGDQEDHALATWSKGSGKWSDGVFCQKALIWTHSTCKLVREKTGPKGWRNFSHCQNNSTFAYSSPFDLNLSQLREKGYFTRLNHGQFWL